MTDIIEYKSKLKSETEIIVFEEIPKYITQLNDYIKSDRFDASLNQEIKEILDSDKTIPTNKTIDGLIETIRPILMDFEQNANLIKLVLLSMAEEFKKNLRDRHNNFLRLEPYDFEDAIRFANYVFADIQSYFESRSSLAAKIIQKPENEGSRRCLQEIDRKFIHKLHSVLIEIRNHYLILYNKFDFTLKTINLALNSRVNSLLSSKYIE
jgi:hypothetical protein